MNGANGLGTTLRSHSFPIFIAGNLPSGPNHSWSSAISRTPSDISPLGMLTEAQHMEALGYPSARLVASAVNHMLRPVMFAVLVAASPAASQTVTLQAEHHTFETDVTLNNRVNARALIDTGATSLALCEDMAEQLGLTLGADVRLSTAAGTIAARRTTIDSVRIGAIEVRNVRAVVKSNDSSCDEVLIGMSVLRKLDSMTLRGDTLTLVGRKATVELPQPQRWRAQSAL